MDKELFMKTCESIRSGERSRNGIGTLKEKTIHAVLKNYFEPRVEMQEVRIAGYVADIRSEQGIIEIQTRNFNQLREKLTAFLGMGPVTIVYPVPCLKWILWIDEETGETTLRRKSPKVGTPYMAFYELYKIKNFLLHSNLKLCIVMIDMEEYRLLNGWSLDRKKGSVRYDRIPVGLSDEVWIEKPEDYQKLIPDGLEEEFISKDYKAASGLSLSQAQTALQILSYAGVIEKTGKKGRSYCYRRREEPI